MAVVTLTVLGAGCGSGSGGSAPTGVPTTGLSTTVAPTSVAPPGAGAGPTSVSDRDNGTTVRLHTGGRLRVVLDSTYWAFAPSSDPAVLRGDGTPVVDPQASGCVPGAGCGTVTATFTAVAGGSATVTATRTTCGEAMRCTGANGRYTVTVVVT